MVPAAKNCAETKQTRLIRAAGVGNTARIKGNNQSFIHFSIAKYFLIFAAQFGCACTVLCTFNCLENYASVS